MLTDAPGAISAAVRTRRFRDLCISPIGADRSGTVYFLLWRFGRAAYPFEWRWPDQAGKTHHFLKAVAHGLADRPEPARKAIRAAVQTARDLAPCVPLFAGGKSLGGRMSSQAQAETPLPGVVGLIFLGFPLRAIGTPSPKRAAHLNKIGIPVFFLQGSRDSLAELPPLTPTIERLGRLATLSVLEPADHSFHVQPVWAEPTRRSWW